MDSITQFVLGAGVGEAVLGKKIGNKALLWGGLAGTIPDLDIVLYPFLDEVGKITVHRGISHSIFFAIFAGLFFGWLFYKWYQKSPDNTTSLKDWALLFGLGFLTHSLLDAFTVYGTQLFLPFSDYRVGFNSIFIVDPIYTVPFILSLIVCSFLERRSKMRRVVSIAGLAFSTLYLCLTLVNKSFANDAFEAAMAEQKIPYTRYMTSPSPIQNVLWYAVAEVEDGYYIGYHSFFDDENKKIDFEFFPRNEKLLADFEGSYALDRLKWFANYYYVVERQGNQIVFNDFTFGKMGFENQNLGYVFSFPLSKDEDGNVSFYETREIPEDVGDVFGMLWKRVKGD